MGIIYRVSKSQKNHNTTVTITYMKKTILCYFTCFIHMKMLFNLDYFERMCHFAEYFFFNDYWNYAFAI